MQLLSGIQRPDLLTSLMNMSLVLRLPCEMHLCISLQILCQCPASFWTCYKTLTFCSLLARCRIPRACHAKRHLNVQKWSEHVVFFTFWLGMCFAPQQRTLFRHLNFQKCSEADVLSTFWLRNVLRATTACTFSTSQLPKVVRRWCVWYILTWKRACATTACNFSSLIAALASLLFDPSEPQIIGKTHNFPTFSRTCIFFLLTLSLLWSSLFGPSPLWLFLHPFILSEVWLLNLLWRSSTGKRSVQACSTK